MNLHEWKKQLQQKYIEDNNLQDSHIPVSVLCRAKILPEKIDVGFKDNKRLFFEESAASLQRRYYGKSDEVARYFLICDGEKVENLDNIIITNNKFTLDFLAEFIRIKDKNINLLNPKGRRPNFDGRKYHNIWVTDEEFMVVKEFIRRLRGER